MGQLTKFGQNNPLWRRVQRHEQMSSLFGQPLPSQTAVSPQTAQPITPTTTGLPDPFIETAVEPTLKPPHAIPQPPPAAVQATTPAAAAASSSDDDDPIWRRLQKINHLHRTEAQPANVKEPPSVQQREAAHSDTMSAPAGEHLPKTSSVPAATEPAETGQPVPLQDAWPVQRQEEAPPSPPAPRTPSQPAAATPTLPRDAAQRVDDELRHVAPGRQTDSPIEMIMPTRPRPQQKPLVQPEALEQRQTAAPPPDEQPEPEPSPTTPPPTTPPPAMINTEIGPLPADLWERLGETPPAPPVAAATVSPVPSSQPPIQPEIPAAPLKPTHTPVPIQRTPQMKTTSNQPTASIEPTPVTQKPSVPPIEHAAPKPIIARPVTQPRIQRAVAEESSPASAVLPVIQVAPKPADSIVQLDAPDVKTAVSPPPPSEQPKAVKPIAKPVSLPASPPLVQRQSAQLQTKSGPLPNVEQPTPDTDISTPPVPDSETPLEKPTLSTSVPQTTAITQPVITPQPTSKLKPPPSAFSPPTVVQQAVQRVEQPVSHPVMQRFPDVGGTQTAVSNMLDATLPQAAMDAAQELGNEVLSPEESEPEAPADEDFDIDALSRRVYRAIKRKLTIEREREYGR